jgi:hypothetical protein
MMSLISMEIEEKLGSCLCAGARLWGHNNAGLPAK